MWGSHTAGDSSSYEISGDMLLGNPFVGLHRVPVAPSGTITGKVFAAPYDPVEGFYISVSREGDWLGRVRTDGNGWYQLDCLAPGQYDIELHLNALESIKSTVTVFAHQQIQVDWSLPRLWQIEGTILDPDGNPNHFGWVEMAPTSKFKRMRANRYDVFGVCPDEYGRFKLFGSEPASFYVRSRIHWKGDVYYQSDSINVTIETGQFLPNLDLWAWQLQ